MKPAICGKSSETKAFGRGSIDMTANEYKSHRERLALTQAELAGLLGVTRETVSRREAGGNITAEAALAIRSLLPPEPVAK